MPDFFAVRFICGLMLAVGVLASCGNDAVELDATVDEIERVLNTPIESIFEFDYHFHIQECMAANGFDEFRLPRSAAGSDFNDEIEARVEAAGGRRAFVELYGSGLVEVLYLEMEQSPHFIDTQLEQNSDYEISELEYEYFYSKPAALPSAEFGDSLTCQEYGLAALRSDYPQFAGKERLNNAFDQHMQDNFDSSPAKLLLDDEFIDCIGTEGFDEVSAGRSPDDIVSEWNNRLAEQDLAPDSPEVQELADFDRRIALARFDCNENIFPRWLELKDTAAQGFFSANASQIAAMTESSR